MPLNNRRRWVTVLSLIPALSLFALMAWALARDIGNPEGLGINSNLGENPTTRSQIPDFSLVSIDGEHITPKNLAGKVVMFDFWSSWCPPCRAEAASLSQVYLEYHNESVEFVGIAIWDDEKDVLAFVQDFNVPYPNAIDLEGITAIDFGVSGIPEKFFVDGSGTIIKKFVGPMNANKLRSILNEMLAVGKAE